MFEEQISRIRAKFAQLKNQDRDLRVFAGFRQKYKLNDVLTPEEIKVFESDYKISLPEEYKAFLLSIGNGGAGPFYGIEKLQDSIYDDIDYKREVNKVNPSLPFPFVDYWNLDCEDFESFEEFENEYFDSKYSNGLIRLCNFGCGIFINLIVNGEDYRKMWTDDRCNNGGIYPSIELGNKEKLNFLDWYELWLDESLKQLNT